LVLGPPQGNRNIYLTLPSVYAVLSTTFFMGLANFD
jgi:hypothetical protein